MKTELPKMTVGQKRKSVRSEIEAHIKEGNWKMLHNGERRLAKATSLIAVEVVDNKGLSGVVKAESFVGGEEMLHRMINIGADINLDDTVEILDNQEAIPEKWRGKYFLTGIICEDGAGRHRVLSFCWGDGRWYWGFGCLRSVFNARDRFVVPATGCP